MNNYTQEDSEKKNIFKYNFEITVLWGKKKKLYQELYPIYIISSLTFIFIWTTYFPHSIFFRYLVRVCAQVKALLESPGCDTDSRR